MEVALMEIVFAFLDGQVMTVELNHVQMTVVNRESVTIKQRNVNVSRVSLGLIAVRSNARKNV
jgi:hypothetical protein